MKAFRTTPEDQLALPVTLAEVKEQLNFDPDDDTRDEILTELVRAAVSEVESFTGLQLMPALYDIKLSVFVSKLMVSVAPVVGVTAIKYKNESNQEITLNSDQYTIEVIGMDAFIHIKQQDVQLSQDVAFPVTITVMAGFSGAGNQADQRAAVPSRAKRSILLKVASWFEKREDHYSPGMMKSSDLLLVPICRNWP
jgi:uncharacterized phiE125 gp8 family phage protein